MNIYNPLVSIIIPCYNQGLFLRMTLESVLAQTYANWECILINDGSEDDTEFIAEEYLEKDHRFTYFSQENKGGCSARNFGLKNAKGDYIQFLDSDDLLENNKIALQIKQLSEYDFDFKIISFTNHLYFKNNDIKQIVYEDSLNQALCHDFYQPMEMIIESWRYLSGCVLHAWLFHRKLLNVCGYWDETLTKNQDGEYTSRVLGLAEKIVFCENTNVYYRCNMNSVSKTMNDTKCMDQLVSVRLIIERIKLYRFDLDVKEIIFKMYMNYMYPSTLNKLYYNEFVTDINQLGYDFELLNRGKLYCFLFNFGGKKFADNFIKLKNTFKLLWISTK